MKLIREEAYTLLIRLGDIINRIRRCIHRSDDASFSINICANCPTGQEYAVGAVFDTEPKDSAAGKNLEIIPDGLTPARVRRNSMNQGIPDKEI